MNNRVVLIGQFPPVVTGQSLITQYIFEKLLHWGCSCTKISFNQIKGNKVLNYFVFYYRFFLKCSKKNLIIYLSPARSNLGYLRNFVIIFYSSLFNNKILLHYHCGDYDEFLSTSNFFVKKSCAYSFNKVSFHIFLSKRLLGNFKNLNLDENKIIFIPNSITTLEPKSIIGFNAKTRTYNIVFMSNMLPSKGYMIVLEAINILINKFKLTNIRCDFYGEFLSEDFRSEKDLVKEFDEYVMNCNLSDFVKYNGLVSGLEKQTVLRNAHIFLLPTEYPVEAQPISILEALSFNLLVIASDFRAIPDMIIDKVTGVLLKTKSPDLLAFQIKDVLNNKVAYTRIADAGRKHFEDNFSSKVFDNNIKMFFKKINAID
jgi:glycosyltransferase involved in cell wall biosynthesis